jgi:putative component of membrane protein insertase Oxa1/YidC/SpoIIIJ protein YidD
VGAVLLAVVSQLSPGPWEQPLAPVFTEGAPVAAERADARPTVLQTIGRGFYFAYRATLSSAKGNTCAFEPSCSLYGHQAIEALGLVPGLLLFGARLMRSHLNFDRFYRFSGARLLDPLDDTLDWLLARETSTPWSSRSSPR